jgi:hypothetical protein
MRDQSGTSQPRSILTVHFPWMPVGRHAPVRECGSGRRRGVGLCRQRVLCPRELSFDGRGLKKMLETRFNIYICTHSFEAPEHTRTYGIRLIVLR